MSYHSLEHLEKYGLPQGAVGIVLVNDPEFEKLLIEKIGGAIWLCSSVKEFKESEILLSSDIIISQCSKCGIDVYQRKDKGIVAKNICNDCFWKAIEETIQEVLENE